MAGVRDTGENIGQSQTLSTTAVKNELSRLERTKSDITWAEGQFKAHAIKREFLVEKVKELHRIITDLSRSEVDNRNKASAAKRIALEAKESAQSKHECLHENTMLNLKEGVSKVTAIAETWNYTSRRNAFRGWIAFASAVFIVALSVAGWWVRHAQLVMEVSDLKENDVSQEATLNRIEGKLDSKSIHDVEGIMAAFKAVIEEKEKVKPKESEPRRRKAGK